MGPLWIYVLFLVAFASNAIDACSRDELQMVQIVSMHCSLSPPYVYPEDPNLAAVWTEGLHDLTMLGKFQAYALGVFLRNFYDDFITSDPREVEVISSVDKGTVKSVQSLVTALYSPTSTWEVVANFSWQPIYIKHDSEEHGFLSNRICPAADIEHKRVLSSESRAVLQTYQNLIYYWRLHSGMELKNLVEVEELFHILETETRHNLTIPEWSRSSWKELEYLHDLSISLRTKSRKVNRLIGGPLVSRTLKTMKEKAVNERDPRKVVVYSTNTVPMMNFLAAMDLGQSERPPPCATVLVELYKQDNEHLVRYLYLNSTMPQREPQVVYSITLPGCTEFCPLSYVLEYTKNIVPKLWEHECQMI